MSAASEYAELLKLIEISGPFISPPVFEEVFPQGLVKDSPDFTREIHGLYRQLVRSPRACPDNGQHDGAIVRLQAEHTKLQRRYRCDVRRQTQRGDR